MAVPSSRRRVRETPEAFERRTSPRLWYICGGLVVGHALLLANLYRIQVCRHEELYKESTKRWRSTRVLLPNRGLIHDRNGALLVQNEPGYAVIVDPNHWFLSNSQAAAAQDQPTNRRSRALAVLKRAFPEADLSELEGLDLSQRPKKSFSAFTIKQWVTEETVEAVRQLGVDLAPPIPEEIKKRKGALARPNGEIPGVSFPQTTRRVALQGTRAAHVLGYTDVRGEQPRLGVEEGQDALLAGSRVKVTYESDQFGVIDATRRVVPEGGKPVPANTSPRAIHGTDLTLTLDAELQHDVEQALGTAVTRYQAESGVAIVLDAKNGDILAMASAPTYNLNQARSKGPKTSAREDKQNWCLELAYEPGSTLKTLTIAAALEQKAVTTSTIFQCSGSRRILNKTIHCATHGGSQRGHGPQNIAQVLQQSCNLATVECGERLGAKQLYHYLTEFGLGEKTNIGLPRETRGRLINPEEKPWRPISLANISFGQGLSVTPLQLAAAYTTFVDGTYHAPRLIQSYHDPNTGKVTHLPPSLSRTILSRTTAQQVRQMLGTVLEEHGTGQPAQVAGYTAGGKTGTAQISDEGAYKGRYAASFVGLVPLNQPQFVILTMIRDPKGPDHFGGSVAGPIFKEIAEKALLLRRIPHDTPSKGIPAPANKKNRKSSTIEA